MLFISITSTYRVVYITFFIAIAKGEYTTYHMEDYCSNSSLINLQEEQKSSIILEGFSEDLPGGSVSCLVNVYSGFEQGIILSINKIIFTESCTSGETVKFITPSKEVRYCESYPIAPVGQSSFLFHEPNLTIEYSSEMSLARPFTDFKVIVTAYKVNHTCSGKREFMCFNGACIWRGLVCDGVNNCGDNSDEEFNPTLPCNKRSSLSYIFLLPVLLLIPFTVVGCKVALFLCLGKENTCIIGRPPSHDDIIPLVTSSTEENYDMYQTQSLQSFDTERNEQKGEITPLVSSPFMPTQKQYYGQQKKDSQWTDIEKQNSETTTPSNAPNTQLHDQKKEKRKQDMSQTEKEDTEKEDNKIESPATTSIEPSHEPPHEQENQDTSKTDTKKTPPPITPVTPPLEKQDAQQNQGASKISDTRKSEAKKTPPPITPVTPPLEKQDEQKNLATSTIASPTEQQDVQENQDTAKISDTRKSDAKKNEPPTTPVTPPLEKQDVQKNHATSTIASPTEQQDEQENQDTSKMSDTRKSDAKKTPSTHLS